MGKTSFGTCVRLEIPYVMQYALYTGFFFRAPRLCCTSQRFHFCCISFESTQEPRVVPRPSPVLFPWLRWGEMKIQPTTMDNSLPWKHSMS